MVTIQDLENSLDEIVTLYTLIKPEELSFNYSEANYYNFPFYKSPLYKFIKNLPTALWAQCSNVMSSLSIHPPKLSL